MMRSIQTAMAAGAAGIVAAGEALAVGAAAAGGAVVAVYAGVAIIAIGGVYYYVTMDAEPEACKPKVESFPEAEARPQSFTTPAHESKPTTHATPAHDQASSSNDKGFDTYEGPDARVFTSDGASIKSRLKDAQLPTEGKIRFVPDKNYKPSSALKRGPNHGYIDKYGNEWTKGPSRTSGQDFEWDVQLSRTGKNKLGWASRDGSHLNVSLDGKVTHK